MLSLIAFFILFGSSLAQPRDHVKSFDSFKSYFDKTYHIKEEILRRNVFNHNLNIIKKHNQEYDEGKHSWYMRVNKLSDLTHDEFMRLNTLKVPDHPKGHIPYAATDIKVAKSVDWRKKGAITNVKDQQSCGSCWAFGAVASIEFSHWEKNGILVSMSEQQLVDCDYRDLGCFGGLPGQAWRYVNQAGGIETEENYSYHGNQGTCQFDLDNSAANVAECVGSSSNDKFDPFCESSNVRRNEEFLILALNDRPQTVAIDASTMQHYGGGVFTNTTYTPCGNDENDLNHAVFAVGYEKHDKHKSFYIIKNSWGVHWGIDGYLHLALGDNNTCGVANYPGFAIAGNLQF